MCLIYIHYFAFISVITLRLSNELCMRHHHLFIHSGMGTFTNAYDESKEGLWKDNEYAFIQPSEEKEGS
jgi:hypothetical protein